MSDLPSGTVTFLFTDIEASTKLAQQYPNQWEALRARHHAILQSAMDGYNGYVFQIIGDAFCVAFHTARDGLQAALDAQAYTWFAKVVAVSEMLIGIALIAGLFIGLTAFFGGFMNWNFIMAGSASVNGVFFGLAVLLVLAWKIAGYIGADYFLLPRVADLWTPQKN